MSAIDDIFNGGAAIFEDNGDAYRKERGYE